MLFIHQHKKKGTHTKTIEVSDKDSLARVLMGIESAELWISESISSVGELMTEVDYGSVNDSTLKSIGYLIAGLSDLQQMVKHTRDMTP